MYYEDFPVGFQFETATRQLSLADMVGFAQLWDPQPFHVDEVVAQASPFGGIIASGFQTLILAFRLTIDTGFFEACSMGSPGMDAVRWMAPVRPGDCLRVRAEVMSARLSGSKPDRGLVTIRYEVLNQDDQPVACYSPVQILQRTPQTDL